VNLIGEHTDYNQGLSLPFAIGEGVSVHAVAIDEPRIEAVAVDLDESDSFSLAPAIAPAEGWRGFVRGAAGELLRSGVALVGARLSISGDVPRGAGLSSSAALEVALTLALIGLAGGSEPDRRELARLCSRIENDWTGAQTGLLDQLASLFGQAGCALRIDFRSLAVDPVALDLDGYRLVTVDSGEQHAHSASGYNSRRSECAEAARALGLESLRDATEALISERLSPPLSLRARHVVTENARVEEAVDALGRRDVRELGRLLDASHRSLRDCFEVSTPAVEEAVRRCKDAGALGARIMGGGFGGHVLALFGDGAGLPEGAVSVRSGPGACLRSIA
jgi:galactokinase